MIFRHKLSGRTLILIERQGQFGLFTEHGELGCAKVPMDMVASAFDKTLQDTWSGLSYLTDTSIRKG